MDLFRFVAVRPPEAPVPDDPGVIEETGVSKAVVKSFKDARKAGRTPADARAQVGQELIESPGYFAASGDWRRLRDQRPQVRAAVVEARAGERKAFVDRAERVLRNAGVREKLARWTQDGAHVERRGAIWTSYYATVLAPDARPGEREELTWWIRFVALVDAAVDGDDTFDLLADAVASARPSVPADLLLDEAPQEGARAEEPPPPAAVERGVARLDELRDAHRRLQQLWSGKQSSFRLASPTVETREERAGEEESGATVSGPPPPWRYELGELDDDRARRVVHELGIDDAGLLPDAIARLEGEIAAAVAEVAAAAVDEEVVGVAGTLAKVRRHRPLRGASEGPPEAPGEGLSRS